VGLYAGARGGEVIVTVPGRSPCYLCATAIRHRMATGDERVGRALDYGTSRLRGEMALAADVHHVASAAVKLALALLLPARCGLELEDFLERALAVGTYLTMSTVPDYWFYPQVFGDAAGQGAYQAVWLTPVRREECPVCGAEEHRVEPLDAPRRAPARRAILEADRVATPAPPPGASGPSHEP
jgi:hypothetical protein